ncbi:hypothetical protein D3C84_1197610 [compost metagenome]
MKDEIQAVRVDADELPEPLHSGDDPARQSRVGRVGRLEDRHGQNLHLLQHGTAQPRVEERAQCGHLG